MIKKLFLSLLFLAFTFSEVFRIETTYGFGIMALDLFVILGSWVWFGTDLVKKKVMFDDLFKLFLSFIGIGIISLLLNPLHLTLLQLELSSLYLVRFLSFGLLFFTFCREKDIKPFLKQWLLVSGISILILGYLQFFLYASLRNLFYLGWDEHLHRLFTTFLDPNFAGVFFVLFFLFLLYTFFHGELQKKFLYPILLLTLIALLLTYSRSAYLCLIISVLVFFFIEKKRKEALVFLSSLSLLFLLLLPTFFTNNTDLFRIASSLSRIASYQEGWTIAKDNLVIGIGFNTYRYAVSQYGYHVQSDVIYNHSEAGNNNSFLFILVTTGIIGLTVYLMFFLRLVKDFAVSTERGFVLSSVVVIVGGSFFNNVLFYTPILFWFLMTLISIKKNT
jgi:O-antigen ligase